MRRTPSLRPHNDQAAEPTADAQPGSAVDTWLSATLSDEAARLRASADPNRFARTSKPSSDSRRRGRSAPPEAAERDTSPMPGAGPTPGRRTAIHRDPAEALADRLERIERKVDTARGGSLADTLRAIEKLEQRRAADTARARPDAKPAEDAKPSGIDFEAALRGFEARIEELSARVAAAPKPIGRRGVPPEAEIADAVAQIRTHQASLDGHGAEAGRSGAPAPRDGATERLAALSQSHAASLEAMRAEIAKLSGQIEARPESSADAGALHAEIEALRERVVTREDIARLVDSIASLTAEVADLQESGGDAAGAAGAIEALQDEVRQLAEARAGADGLLADQVDLLFGKIDAIAASGADTAVIEGLARQLHEMRAVVADPLPSTTLSALGEQLSELQRDVASLSRGQIGSAEFNELKSVVESMRSAFAGPLRAEAHPRDETWGAGDGTAAQASIEAMLASLIDKLDRVERKVSDPDALDQLERQIERLNASIREAPQRDPALVALESSMSELLAEVATWREGAAVSAERAARSAVAESLDGLPRTVDLDRSLADLAARIDGADQRTQDSLATVHAALDEIARRVSGLEGGRPDVRPDPEADAAARSRPSAARAVSPGAEPPIAPAWDEVLLEPGAARPGAAKPEAGPAPDLDPADIKARLIAAARHAANAASSDAAPKRAPEADRRPGMLAGSPGRLPGPSDAAARLRAAVDARRRPLLLAAAALALVLGGFQLVRTFTTEPAPQAVSSAPPAATTPPQAPAVTARPEPTTTQSVGPRRDAPGPDARAPEPDRPVATASALEAPPATPGIPLMAAASLAPRPAPAPEVAAAAVVPPGLRLAADKGNVVALFDLASRTAEGRGVTRDVGAAASLFEKAAEKGFAPAQYRTGNLYEKGVGVARDLEAAKTWYKKAADAGNTRAMHNLAVLIAESSGAKPDYASAITWFKRAAEHGVRDSQFNLAVLYARGLGAAQDLAKSYLWLAIAAAAGDAEAAKKRDEVAARLPAPDLARAKSEAEAFKAAPANPAANEVKLPEAGWQEAPIKRASR